MKKVIIGVMIFCLSYSAFARSELASNFIEKVKIAANGDGVISEAIDIKCPTKSASGRLLITKASYDYGSSKGAFIFSNTDDAPAILMSITTQFHNDDFSSDKVDGYEFGFKMHGGQLFVTVMKDGKASAGVNVNGTSGVAKVKCKVIKPE